MPLLNFFLSINPHITINLSAQPEEAHPFLKFLTLIAPILSVLASMASLYLAVRVFKYTQQKNVNDVKIKWFQELVYTPNRERINSYFDNLYNLNKNFKSQPLSSDERIELMNLVKEEQQHLLLSFVDLLQPISGVLYTKVTTAIETLTDQLVNVLDDDNLDFYDASTYALKVTANVSKAREVVVVALFNYQG